VPDCDWTPEQAIGLTPGVPPDQQFPRRFAEAGCRIIVPSLIDRSDRFAGNPDVRSVKHSQRETLWRAGYELGRSPLGYEIQKILAAADWMEATRSQPPRSHEWPAILERIRNPASCKQELGMVGYGEGGLLALYAGALDSRFLAVGVCGAFGLGERLSEQPIYRNVWSLMQRFGDAELAAMIMPRALIVEWGRYPEVVHSDAQGGAPGKLWRPAQSEWRAEQERFEKIMPEMPANFLMADASTVGDWSMAQRLYRKLCATGGISQTLEPPPAAATAVPDPLIRARRQYIQILEDTQWLLRESEYTRRDFWKQAVFTNASAFAQSVSWYRDYFRNQIVGEIGPPSMPANPRSRFWLSTNGWRGFEVMLDVYPDVYAYGIILVPDNLKPGDKRPVVVCQHGLEGRPTDTIQGNHPAYRDYASQLARKGYVVFAPQNPYLGRTEFRQLQRKSQPLGLTLWSFIAKQHQVITDWLAALEFVDPSRIALYGLSYGGKTAMRVPVLVDRYCLSICSADYNEWIWKNVSARSPYSYLWTMEYDMPEFNLGNTFNYSELSWLIFPRPFMVERGHDDGVAPDEWVAFEFAKTKRHYVKLGMGDRAAIEFFDGPHAIHGKGTFDFLERHLRFP
jgi:dienelactone hydrolase